MTGETFDVVIIGGGPAGSSAAIRLALAGKKVLLAEKAKFPREKLCGEFVSPECLEHLSELGVLPESFRQKMPAIKQTVFYSVKGRKVEISNAWLDGSNELSLGISRSLLDDILLRQAKEIGVDVRTETAFVSASVIGGRLSGVDLRSDDGRSTTVSSPIAIDATGRNRVLSRFFEDEKPKRADLVAFKCHLRNAGIENETCEIFSYPGGYGGCTEIEEGRFNICFIVDSKTVRKTGNDPQKVFHNVVCINQRARTVLSDPRFVGEWLAVPILRFGRTSLSSFPGVFAVGDAAAFIDPFTGSGIALALQSAKIASDAITSGQEIEDIVSVYAKAHSLMFDCRLSFCRVLRLASTSPLLAELTIRTINKNAYLGKLFAAASRFTSTEHQRSNA